MPCEAEKTSRDPGPFLLILLRLIRAISPWLTVVDKSQVFALRLNRRKFAKNAIDLIRCKFSIDAGFPFEAAAAEASTLSKPYPVSFGNPTFTICIE
jgi:hypothetical protein